VTDPELVAFLQWAAPRMGLRWEGFRRVRGIVRKRIRRRMTALGLATTDAYRAHLDRDPSAWAELAAICRMPISRFHRDRAIFAGIVGELLPSLARVAAREGRTTLRVWSAGCASGEEPFTIAIGWHLTVAPSFPGLALDLLATDAEPTMIARAKEGTYPAGSLRELPAAWREEAFDETPEGFRRLRDRLRAGVIFRCEDLRAPAAAAAFDLVLCRNLAFTYFDDAGQREAARLLSARLRSGGFLVVGAHEALPSGAAPSLAPHGPSVYVQIAD
jgi:chemotaxis protein methyltransferase CheR